jgi:hypothetical protein
MKVLYALVVFIALTFTACNKDNGSRYNPTVEGELTIEFDNIVGTSDLQLSTGSYVNSSGEKFTVSNLKYYVSNFSLIKTDGTVYIVPQDSCYFLVDESDESTHEPLIHVPEGEYKSLSFILGVDSLRSTMSTSERIGVLDTAGTAKDLYRGLNSGYIFFDMEGNSPSSPAAGKYDYQIGGYGGKTIQTINNIKKISLDLTERGIPKVKSGKETNIHLMIDVLKLFNGKSTISIAKNPEVMFTDFSSHIADNFPLMIEHDHTEN